MLTVSIISLKMPFIFPKCDKCDGRGYDLTDCPDCDENGKVMGKCGDCEGKGKDDDGVECALCDGIGLMDEKDCDNCEGKAKIPGDECSEREGKTYIERY